MFEKLEEVERRYETLYHLLGQPEVISKQDELQKVAKEYAEIGKVVDLYRKFKRLDVEIEESRHLLASEDDEEMKRLAKEELELLMAEKEKIDKLTLTVDTPAGPKSYNIAKNADVTVVLYVGKKIKAVHTFKKGELGQKGVEAVLADLPKILDKK